MDSFQSIGSITSWYVDNPGHFLEVVKPGSFTDADMVSYTRRPIGSRCGQQGFQLCLPVLVCMVRVLLMVFLSQYGRTDKVGKGMIYGRH